jgi:hypothetical protein
MPSLLDNGQSMKTNIGRHDTQYNDTQHNDTQHNDTQHNNKKETLSIMTFDTAKLSVIYAECHK